VTGRTEGIRQTIKRRRRKEDKEGKNKSRRDKERE